MEWIDYITSNTSKSLRCTINQGEYTNHRRFDKKSNFLQLVGSITTWGGGSLGTPKNDYVNKDHCNQETHLNFFLFYLYNSSDIRQQNIYFLQQKIFLLQHGNMSSPTENISSPTGGVRRGRLAATRLRHRFQKLHHARSHQVEGGMGDGGER